MSTVVIGTLAAGAAVLAVASPAAAINEGEVLPGAIYWFSQAGPLAEQSAATQLTSGSGTGRPWVTLTTENACPAAATNMLAYVRIPQAGVPEDDWTQVQLGALTMQKDAEGRFYTSATNQADRLSKAEVLAYNTANGGSGTFPFLAACKDDAGNSLGHFKTTVTITGTVNTNISWSLVSPPFTGGGSEVTATTTSLAATAAGADLLLTATVGPAGAAGDVTFKDGATVLGVAPVVAGAATYTVTAPAQGNHTYSAEFVPADPAAYGASQGSQTVTIGLDAATGQIVVTVPAAPVSDGALTFSVPFDTPVTLAGSRDGANTRVVAAGAFPTVTVTDTRRDGLLTGWEVNAQATEFTGTAGTVGAKYLGWTPALPLITPDAGSPLVAQAGPAVASALDDDSSAGLGASSLLGRSATPGRGVTAFDAALALAVPGSTAEGSYTSTVTVTLIAD